MKAIRLCLLFLMAVIVSGTAVLASIPSQSQIDALRLSKAPPNGMLIPGGQPIGIKMDMGGVLVVGTDDKINSGLEVGDTILEVNGEKVRDAKEVQAQLSSNTVSLKVQRKQNMVDITLQSVKAVSGCPHQIGVWVRDKTAGLGTLTYYDPSNDTFGSLGHSITDPDTGDIPPMAAGEIIKSKVTSVIKGVVGKPGELRGTPYEAYAPLGKLEKNTKYGIFGKAYHNIKNPMYPNAIPIGYQNEVKKGNAYILASLDGSKVEKYEIEIEKINHQSKPGTKSMVLHATDPRLLKKSGGFVQGMSGSPIIQNGKIIGAVTHCFVKDPERGYGIFIEWMLQNTDSQVTQ